MNPKNQSPNTAQAKKPLYKRWWFWTIIIVVLGLIAAVNQPENSDDKSTTASTENSENESKTPESTNKNDEAPETPPTTDTEGTSSSENASGYKVGETIVLKDRKITITGVERNFSTDNYIVKPADGNEFVKINISITNTSTSNIRSYTSDWKIQDSNGVIDGYNSLATAMADNGFDITTELAGGGHTSGSLVFEVPKDDNNLQLQYKASFLNTVVIKL